MGKLNLKNRVDDIFTSSNECLENYKKVYDFSNARVLSVVGSGDQYFTSILNGAKEVELFDINKAAWDYFRLRFYAIQILSYEEYLIYFVMKISSPYLYNGKIIDIYEKILKYIPEDLKYFLHEYIRIYHIKKEGSFVINLSESESFVDKQGNPIIMPHFSKEEYYKLQSFLYTTKLPDFRWINLLNLAEQVDKKYDLMLFSNIYDYLFLSAEEYVAFLKQLNAPIIQAYYSWSFHGDVEKLCNLGCYANTFITKDSCNMFNNCIISLKRVM